MNELIENIKIPSELLYPVRKVEFPVEAGLTNSYNSHMIVVDRPTGKLIVNHCSEEYRLIRNSTILNPLIDGLKKDHKLYVSGRSWNNAVFNMRIAIDNAPGTVVKDKLYPMLDILNSYNGKIRCIVNMGVFRGVCSNGLVVPTENRQYRDFSHTPSNEEELAVKKILVMFESFLADFTTIEESYDDLKIARVFNVERRVEEVMEATKFPARLQEEVIDRINVEMAQLNTKATDWLVYNGFNFQLNHNPELEWEPKKRNSADQEVLEFLLNN